MKHLSPLTHYGPAALLTAWIAVAVIACDNALEPEGYTLEDTMDGDVVNSQRVSVSITSDGIEMPTTLRADRYALFVQNHTRTPVLIFIEEAGPGAGSAELSSKNEPAPYTIPSGRGITIQQRFSQGEYTITTRTPSGDALQFTRTVTVKAYGLD